MLARDGNKALLLSKDIQEERRFDEYPGGDNEWQDSEMRTYLNGDWLTGKTNINAHISQTTINTKGIQLRVSSSQLRSRYSSLSEADVYGTINTNLSSQKVAVAKDYSNFESGVIVPDNMRIAQNNGPADWWWLRSPRRHTSNVANVT